MSGRKQWEVASVLSESEKVLKEISSLYKTEINENISIVKDAFNSVKSKKDDIEKIDDENIKKEANDFSFLVKEIEKIKNDFDVVLDEIEIENQKAKLLREKIKGKNHYMDKEYEEAVSIRNTILKKRDKLRGLKNSSYSIRNRAIRVDAFLRNVEDLLKAKIESYNELIKKSYERLNKKEYVLLEDFVNGNTKKVSKVEYYDHYKKENNKEKLEFLLNKAKEELKNKNFSEVDRILQKVNENIDDLSNKADSLKEDIESSFNLAIKMRDIMLDEANFKEAYLDLINNNPAEGFKLVCKNGDTIIFDEIKVENGNTIVNLDHIEGVNGNCSVKWKDLKNILNDYGIPLLDVLKDGHSVIYANRVKDKSAKYERRRDR